MEILDILDIKELEMEYTARLKIELIWHDERITFRNLKQNIYDNQLNTRDIERIWLLYFKVSQLNVRKNVQF